MRFIQKVQAHYIRVEAGKGKSPNVWFAPKNGDINDAQAKWMQDHLDKGFILWTEEEAAKRYIFIAAKTFQAAKTIYKEEGISPQHNLEPYDPGECFTVSDDLQKQIDKEFDSRFESIGKALSKRFDAFEIGHKNNAGKLQEFTAYGNKLMGILEAKYGVKFKFKVEDYSTAADPVFNIETGSDIPPEFLKDIGHRRVLRGFPVSPSYSKLIQVFGKL